MGVAPVGLAVRDRRRGRRDCGSRGGGRTGGRGLAALRRPTVGSVVGSRRVCVGERLLWGGRVSLLTSPYRVPDCQAADDDKGQDAPDPAAHRCLLTPVPGNVIGRGGTGPDPPPDMAFRLGRSSQRRSTIQSIAEVRASRRSVRSRGTWRCATDYVPTSDRAGVDDAIGPQHRGHGRRVRPRRRSRSCR